MWKQTDCEEIRLGASCNRGGGDLHTRLHHSIFRETPPGSPALSGGRGGGGGGVSVMLAHVQSRGLHKRVYNLR